MNKVLLALVWSLGPLSFSQAQGTFENLDFEEANPVSADNPLYPYNVTAASALPSWTVTIGGVQQTQVNYNGGSGGAPLVTLLGPPPPTPALVPIDENYSVLLSGSFSASVPSISQSGLIPAGTESLLFQAAQGNAESGELSVAIGSQNIPFTAIAIGPNFTLYEGSISAWAGKIEQITFTADQDVTGPNDWELDDISFSTQDVPEPDPFLLTGLGGTLFALYRRFAPKRK